MELDCAFYLECIKTRVVAGHTAQASAVTTKDIAVGFKPALAAEEAGPAGYQTSVRECHHGK